MKKFCILFIAFALVAICLFLLPTEARAAEIVSKGYCGYNWDNLQWILDDEGTLTIFGTGKMSDYSQWEGNPAIKKVVIEEGVTDIDTEAFANCHNLTSVIIPSTATAIYYGAFYDCDSLTSITIPSGVTKLGDRVFYSCDNLADMTISGNITSIGTEVFSGCNNLQSITITEGVTTIIDSAFAYLSGLKTVTIPASITSIGADAFESCNAMTGVYITDLEAWCRIDFENGYSNPLFRAKNIYLDNKLLTDIVIPDGITTIKNVAFYNADCLTSVTLPEGLMTIGDNAFLDCENLVSVNIPASVTSMGMGAFGNCKNLTQIHITDIAAWCTISHYQYENPLSHNSNSYLYINGVVATDIVIPMGVTKIAPYAFYGYDNLNSVILPNGIEYISEYAFAHTGLKEIVLPDVADGIYLTAAKAFYNCRFTNVFHRGAKADWESVYGHNTFENVEVTHEYVSSTHYWDNGVITQQPTCKENGIKTFTCTVCDHSYTEDIEKLTTHSYDDGVETKAPTCKEAGIKTFTCTVCDDSYTEKIGKSTEHSYDDGAETKSPTCKEAGIKTFTCTVCDHSYTEEIDKSTEHSYDDGVETKAPTCKEAGIKTFTCTVCDHSYTEEIDKSTEHSYTDGVCTLCGGNDPDYVAPSDPVDPDVDTPTEPEVPSEEETKSFFEVIAAFFEKLFRILFFFLYL